MAWILCLFTAAAAAATTPRQERRASCIKPFTGALISTWSTFDDFNYGIGLLVLVYRVPRVGKRTRRCRSNLQCSAFLSLKYL